MTLAIVEGFFVLAGLILLGSLVVRIILGRFNWLDQLSLAFPVGGGVFTFVIFLTDLFRLPINGFTVVGQYIVLLAGALVYLRWRDGSAAGQAVLSAPVRGVWRWMRVVVWVGFGLLIMTAIYIAVTSAYGRWDAAAGWAIKGYGIFLEGNIEAGSAWGAWGLAYPLNVPLQIGLFKLFGGDPLPVSKVLFPLFLGSLGVTLYRHWRRRGISDLASSFGLLLLLTVPVIYLHGTVGYANLPLAAYLVPGVLWAIEGITQEDRRSMVMSGLMLGLACWTRAEAISFCLAAVAAIVVGFWLTGQRRFHLIPWLTPVVLIACAWFLFGWQSVSDSHLGKAMRGVLPSILAGQWRLHELYLIPRLLLDRGLDPKIWGVLYPVAAVLMVLGVAKLHPRKNPDVFVTFLATAAVSAVPVGLFYVRSFTRYSDFIPLLNRSFDRAFIPAAFLICASAVVMALQGAARSRNAAGSLPSAGQDASPAP